MAGPQIDRDRLRDISKLQPDGEAKKDLLSDVRAFQKASLAGEYYEGFKVNSRTPSL